MDRSRPRFAEGSGAIHERLGPRVETREAEREPCIDALGRLPEGDDAPLSPKKRSPGREGDLEPQDDALGPRLRAEEHHRRPRERVNLVLEKLLVRSVRAGHADGDRRLGLVGHGPRRIA
jgi:hypothetical protein